LPNAYHLVVVTPERVMFDDQVVLTVAPGSEGELGVMARHAPLMTELCPGEVRATLPDGRVTSHMVISGGFMEVSYDGTTILADSAERADEIDITRAETDLGAAKAMLSDTAAGSPEAAQAKQAIQHAESRIRASRAVDRKS
jgi:F-type H+-transporting ATPase subunit epsilon